MSDFSRKTQVSGAVTAMIARRLLAANLSVRFSLILSMCLDSIFSAASLTIERHLHLSAASDSNDLMSILLAFRSRLHASL